MANMMRSSVTGKPSARRVWLRAVAGIVVAGMIIPATAGPVAAAVLPALAERETWSLEEREEHGEDLWGKDAVKGDEPVAAHEKKTSPVGDPPAIVKGAPATDTATDSGSTGDDGGGPSADVVPGQVTLKPHADKPVRGEAGSLPVTIELSTASAKANKATVGGNGKGEESAPVRIRALGAKAAERAGITGVFLTVTNAPAGPAEAEASSFVVDLAVDTRVLGMSPDWVSRARLVQLPACVLTTPAAKGCDRATELPAVDDAVPAPQGTVAAVVEVPEAGRSTLDAAGRQVGGSEQVVLAVAAGTTCSLPPT